MTRGLDGIRFCTLVVLVGGLFCKAQDAELAVDQDPPPPGRRSGGLPDSGWESEANSPATPTPPETTGPVPPSSTLAAAPETVASAVTDEAGAGSADGTGELPSDRAGSLTAITLPEKSSSRGETDGGNLGPGQDAGDGGDGAEEEEDDLVVVFTPQDDKPPPSLDEINREKKAREEERLRILREALEREIREQEARERGEAREREAREREEAAAAARIAAPEPRKIAGESPVSIDEFKERVIQALKEEEEQALKSGEEEEAQHPDNKPSGGDGLADTDGGTPVDDPPSVASLVDPVPLPPSSKRDPGDRAKPSQDRDRDQDSEDNPSSSVSTSAGVPAPIEPAHAQSMSLERVNYASMDCGAKVLGANTEATEIRALITGSKDSYMINVCSAPDKWVVVELCETLVVEELTLANFEFFSSMFKDVEIYGSLNYPADDWERLGSVSAANSRAAQVFDLRGSVDSPPVWVKYLKFVFAAHYGSEYYCPVSMVKVNGLTEIERWKLDLEKSSSVLSKVEAVLSKAKPDSKKASDAKKPNAPRAVDSAKASGQAPSKPSLPAVERQGKLVEVPAGGPESPPERPDSGPDEEAAVAVSGGSTTAETKESIFTKLTNRILDLEINHSLGNQYLKDINEKYTEDIALLHDAVDDLSQAMSSFLPPEDIKAMSWSMADSVDGLKAELADLADAINHRLDHLDTKVEAKNNLVLDLGADIRNLSMELESRHRADTSFQLPLFFERKMQAMLDRAIETMLSQNAQRAESEAQSSLGMLAVGLAAGVLLQNLLSAASSGLARSAEPKIRSLAGAEAVPVPLAVPGSLPPSSPIPSAGPEVPAMPRAVSPLRPIGGSASPGLDGLAAPPPASKRRKRGRKRGPASASSSLDSMEAPAMSSPSLISAVDLAGTGRARPGKAGRGSVGSPLSSKSLPASPVRTHGKSISFVSARIAGHSRQTSSGSVASVSTGNSFAVLSSASKSLPGTPRTSKRRRTKGRRGLPQRSFSVSLSAGLSSPGSASHPVTTPLALSSVTLLSSDSEYGDDI